MKSYELLPANPENPRLGLPFDEPIQTERQQLLDEIQRLNLTVSRLNGHIDELLAWIKRLVEAK